MTFMSYTGCNELIEKYGTSQFMVAGFPCSQFMNQEPGKDETEILNCLRYVRPGDNFVPNFLLFEKSDVNGDPTTVNPVFNWLKSGCGPTTSEILVTDLISWSPVYINDITWNFEKFLVSKTGQLVRRYSPETFPQLLAGDIFDLINDE